MEIKNLVNTTRLPFDLRAEVLGRLLADKHELDWEQVLMRPGRFFQRLGRKDVVEVADGFSLRLDKSVVWIDISREGIMDVLPEELFDHAGDGASDEQLVATRKFCLPFEQLFYWLRLGNEQRETKSELNLEKQWWGQFLSEDYEGYTPLADVSLDKKQKHILYAMIPQLSDILGNWTLTEQWLSLLMDMSIEISEIPPPEYVLPETIQLRLGTARLGQDFIIGSSFCDGIPNIKIFINGLTADTIGNYLIDGEKRNLLETLLTMMIPVETPYHIELSLKVKSNFLQVGAAYSNSVLGYTTVL